MSDAAFPDSSANISRDDAYWAQPVSKLRVSDVPTGAINLNVDGRQVVSPVQGFGQLWSKTYRVRLSGGTRSPAEVMQIWKSNFPKFQPNENRFYPSMEGIQPGQIVLINAAVPAFPGTPSILPVAGGVMILYADEVCFTVMTPEGFPEAGWNTFSTYEEDGSVVAQIQSLIRSNDPLYEIFYRFLGSSDQQDKTWTHVLLSLAGWLGIQGQVQSNRSLIDPQIQWGQWTNIWKNAGIRTVFYLLLAPLRWVRNLFKRRPSVR